MTKIQKQYENSNSQLTFEQYKKALRDWQTQGYLCKNRKDRFGNDIKFLLSFEEWLSVWLDSGHLAERGRRAHQYVMSRYDDIGNYEIGNVFIQLQGDNFRDFIPRVDYSHKRKAVSTPFGDFDSIENAAAALDLSRAGVRYRIINIPGYSFL